MSISVCIPARDEASTIGDLVRVIHEELVLPGIVEECIVLDHESIDETAEIASNAGATVVNASSILPEFGPALGKGDVLWRSVWISRGDIIVWLDADLESFEPSYVHRLTYPLRIDQSVLLVKGACHRSLNGRLGEGGRVTELAAKPAIQLLRPDLGHITQPLTGQCAIRRTVAEELFFEVDYGVEIGLLLDTVSLAGLDSVVEVPLGHLEHRHRPLCALREQSTQVLRALLSRQGHHVLRGLTEGRPPIAALRTPDFAA